MPRRVLERIMEDLSRKMCVAPEDISIEWPVIPAARSGGTW
jgi:hypothetical protein